MTRELTEFEKKLRRMRANQDTNDSKDMPKFKPESFKNLSKKPKISQI